MEAFLSLYMEYWNLLSPYLDYYRLFVSLYGLWKPFCLLIWIMEDFVFLYELWKTFHLFIWIMEVEHLFVWIMEDYVKASWPKTVKFLHVVKCESMFSVYWDSGYLCDSCCYLTFALAFQAVCVYPVYQ